MQVKAGFTLMELMVAVACASVLALAVMGGYAAYRKVHARYTESYGRMSVDLYLFIYFNPQKVFNDFPTW